MTAQIARIALDRVSDGRLIFCRHGQTEFNATFRFQGHIDTPLNEVGRWQAEALRRRLADEKVDVVYSSDLSRSRDTAAIATAEMAVPVVEDRRLREASFGRWEGLTFAQIEARFPDDVVRRRQDPIGFAVPGGESMRLVAERVADFLEEVVLRHTGQSILVVAHGGTMNVAFSVLLGLPLMSWWRLRNYNAGLSIVEFTSEGPKLARFNDTCHLGFCNKFVGPGENKNENPLKMLGGTKPAELRRLS